MDRLGLGLIKCRSSTEPPTELLDLDALSTLRLSIDFIIFAAVDSGRSGPELILHAQTLRQRRRRVPDWKKMEFYLFAKRRSL